MAVILAKIRTGEVVIGKEISSTGGISECLMVRNRQVSPTKIETMLTPVFMMMSEDLVSFKIEDIVTKATPVSDLEAEYTRSTSSLVLPTYNGVIHTYK